MRLHHVQVSCPRGGEGVARVFYGSVLGLVEVEKPSTLASRGGVWFRGQAYELHVGIEEHFRPATKAHPAFAVDDIDQVAERLRQAGHPVSWDNDLPGYRRFYTRDGAGNRVEILTDRQAE
jgi:catechol 2,3-dioxygenase-like lactoylglutathione lyase family enzyme